MTDRIFPNLIYTGIVALFVVNEWQNPSSLDMLSLKVVLMILIVLIASQFFKARAENKIDTITVLKSFFGEYFWVIGTSILSAGVVLYAAGNNPNALEITGIIGAGFVITVFGVLFKKFKE